jgi:hypothetical protein
MYVKEVILEVAGGWRRLYNEELQIFYVLLSIIMVTKIKEDETGGAYCPRWRRKKYITCFGWKT